MSRSMHLLIHLSPFLSLIYVQVLFLGQNPSFYQFLFQPKKHYGQKEKLENLIVQHLT